MNKKYFLRFIKLSLLFSLFWCSNLFMLAADTTFVQTLTFDSISARRGIWKFPDNPNEYRKILMYHTLKCDPNKVGDYPCGEWDYLTYSMVNKHTGVYDSTKVLKPLYKLGKLSPDTIFTNNTPLTYTKLFNEYKRTFVKTTTESSYVILNGSAGEIKTNTEVFRTIFDVSSAEIKASGIAKGDISKIKIYVKTPGTVLKNFTVKLGALRTGGVLASLYQSSKMETYFTGDLLIDKAGWVEIPLNNDYNWPGLGGMTFDISFESSTGNPGVFAAINDTDAYFVDKSMNYLSYKDFNSFIEAKNVPELTNASNLSFEGWVKVDSWSKWAFVFGQGDNTLFQLGDVEGNLYCILRNSSANTYGSIVGGLPKGVWTHIAMTYDGNASGNDNRLKCYINGKQVKLTFNGTIPPRSENTNAGFTVCSGSYNSAPFIGSFKDVRAWKTTLDSANIVKYMNSYILSDDPIYKDLLVNYKFDDFTATSTKDDGNKSFDAKLLGCPFNSTLKTTDIFWGAQVKSLRPNISFVQGTYETQLDSTTKTENYEFPKFGISRYRIENRGVVLDSVLYSYVPGYSITENTITGKIDSVYNQSTGFILNSKMSYYEKPFEKLDVYEIGRYITPYGINLDLGPKGFTWIYDVTDYAPLLTGLVDFSAGNNQELIDVKFAFIKGTPPRNVLNITKIAGPAKSFLYKNLDQDINIYDSTYVCAPGTKTARIKTRLTGHGHNSNTGSFPHCCEWKDNEHQLWLNGELGFTWHIWQELDCALNPVYPQGGTWPGSREGWCPGDRVKDHDFEVTPFLKNNKIEVDYAITPVPENNQGMGNGNYVTNIDLIQYGDLSFKLDAEIYDVLTPNNLPLYSRMNPICASPKIIVRNNGSEIITSMDIEYGVSGGNKQYFSYTCNLASMAYDTITLPVPASGFWIGDGKNEFTATVKKVNGQIDGYSENDSYKTNFKMPDIYKPGIYLYYQTNKRPNDYSVKILNMQGQQVFTQSQPGGEVLYKNKLDLPNGCYVLKVIDPENMGLSYWAYKEQGNGYVKICDAKGNVLKAFNPDFGHEINYAFTISDQNYVMDHNYNALLNLFPNPADGILKLRVDQELGESSVKIYDIYGKKLMEQSLNIVTGRDYELNLTGFNPGGYLVKVSNGLMELTKDFIKK